jgi:hypothetical protein
MLNRAANVIRRFPKMICLTLIAPHLMSGCATTASVPQGTPVAVVNDQAPFYKFGPAQAAGPDARLTKGQRGVVLSHEFGFSRVQLDNGETGYVDSGDIAPAPDEVPGSPSAEGAPSPPQQTSGGENPPVQPTTPPPQGVKLPPSDEPAPSFRY